MIRQMLYFLRKALDSMIRAPFLTSATVGMLMVIFVLFNGYALVSTNVSNMAARWVGQVRMTIFLTEGTTPESAQEMGLAFRKMPEVTTALYVSREEARSRFLRDFPASDSILEGLDSSPFPASLELELAPEVMTVDALSNLSLKFRDMRGVEDVVYGRELFGKLSTLVGLLRLIGIFLGVALVVAVIFLTANTIRLNLYARRAELDILQVVGATRWFIRWPFLIEGFLQGIAGAALSLLVTLGIYAAISEPLAEAISGPLGQFAFQFFGAFSIILILLAGALLGALGSFIAIGRFWKAI